MKLLVNGMSEIDSDLLRTLAELEYFQSVSTRYILLGAGPGQSVKLQLAAEDHLSLPLYVTKIERERVAS